MKEKIKNYLRRTHILIVGFKQDRIKLLEIESKARMEERTKLDKYYQLEIDKIRREHVRTIEQISKNYENEKKEAMKDSKRESAGETSQLLQGQKSKYKKIISDKNDHIIRLKEDIQLLKNELVVADTKLQKSQKAYRKYREYALQTVRYSSMLADEVKEIFSISGNLFQRFTLIRDKVSSIDHTNSKYTNDLLELLDMDDSDLLLCIPNLEEIKGLR